MRGSRGGSPGPGFGGGSSYERWPRPLRVRSDTQDQFGKSLEEVPDMTGQRRDKVGTSIGTVQTKFANYKQVKKSVEQV